MPIPVIISNLGIPVRAVDRGAPEMQVSNNGLGIPIRLSDRGVPFVVLGLNPPIVFDWQQFDMIAGGEGQWIGYSTGAPTTPQPAFGSITRQPTVATTLLAFYDDTASGVFLAVFAGNYVSQMAGLQLSIGGFVVDSFEVQLISGNTWVRFNGIPGDLVVGARYQVLFGNDIPIPLRGMSTLWIDPQTSYQGTAAAVTAINADGSGGYVLPIAGPTTSNAVTHTAGDAGGFNFNIGRFFSLTGLSVGTGDGFMLFLDVTPGAISGTQQYMIFGNQTGGIRSSGANYQVISSLTAPQVVGTAAIGDRRILALEVDRVAGRISYRDPVSGAIQRVPGTNVALVVDRINLGQGTLCRIHRAAIVERPIGAQFPISFTDALTSFTGSQPIPVSSVVIIHDADGQSESLGPNAGGALSPDGRAWRNVFRGPQVLTAEGLRRTDGGLVTQAGSPLLGGYDLNSTATGLMQTFIGGNCPVGLMAAHMLARDGFYDNPVGFQFHGAGGQQVYNFDDNPNTGTEGLVVLYENQQHWLSQMAAYCATQEQTVIVPRRYWMQGGTDERLEKGEYTARFRTVNRSRFDLIKGITGQPNDPRLFIWQPGQVMWKQWPQHFRTDILEIVREWDAVFVGPMYPILIADGFVHPGINETVMMGEMDAWATTEVEAGRSWNLMPPVSVTRSGDTITIPITVRSDETLTAPAGKYAGPYGGDPENLGLTVVGGGSIVSASVSGGNIVLQVNGSVTAVQYAIAPIGADMRTFVDADGKGYSVNRGLIRTTLTKQVASFGGLNVTLQRWVPAFEVAVA